MARNDELGTELSVSTRLDGWKEIASYLKRSVRTAQRWERELDLPVRRLQSVKGEIVFAFPHELDRWLISRDVEPDSNDSPGERAGTTVLTNDSGAPEAQCTPVPGNTAEPVPREPRTDVAPTEFAAGPAKSHVRIAAVLAAFIVVALCLAGMARWTGRLGRKRPTSIRTEQNAIVALDAQGRELWRHVFSRPIANGMDEEATTWLGDLDEDGEPEILVAYRSTVIGESAFLYCFDAEGKQRWQFTPGHTVRTATETFTQPYVVRDFTVLPLSGRKVIAVSSANTLFYPDQVAILDTQGHLLREYWHSGHLNRIVAADDDKPVLYASGINNEYRTATVVALDPEHLGGASQQTDSRYQLLDMPMAREARRVYFPRSCISRAAQPYNDVAFLVVTGDDIRITTREQYEEAYYANVNYILNKDLDIVRAYFNDSFFAQHKKLRLQKVLDHDYKPGELDELISRYKDQKSFLKVHGPEGVH